MQNVSPIIARPFLTLLLSLALIAVALVGIRSRIETTGDRVRISNRCLELSKRIKNDSNSREAINELARIMKGNWPFARVQAICAFRDAGPNAMPAIDELIRMMDSSELDERADAIVAVGEVSKGSSVGVDPLMRQLKVDDWHKSSLAASALGEIGAPAEKAIGALQKLADESDNSIVESCARRAIEDIQSDLTKVSNE